MINNGVDHVDDAQPDLSSLLQGLFDADASGSSRLPGLTPVDGALLTNARLRAFEQMLLFISEGVFERCLPRSSFSTWKR